MGISIASPTWGKTVSGSTSVSYSAAQTEGVTSSNVQVIPIGKSPVTVEIIEYSPAEPSVTQTIPVDTTKFPNGYAYISCNYTYEDSSGSYQQTGKSVLVKIAN